MNNKSKNQTILSKSSNTLLYPQQRSKFVELVGFSRKHSPYYRKLYHALPNIVDCPEDLPITNKRELMGHFDEWSTDPAVTHEKIMAFIKDASKIGEQFLGKYHVAVTSGTTGNHGIFLMDKSVTAVSEKINRKAKFSWIGLTGIARLLKYGMRMAAITATNEHFGFLSGINYLTNNSHFWRTRIKAFSIHMPVSELVDRLNAFQPALIMGYASMIALLADEQEHGNLNIHPAFIEVMSEKLTAREFQKIGRVFHVNPYQMYGSTEAPFANSICKHGWYHINPDVVILEAVDERYQPVMPGTMSHTALVTNLVNRLQPIIRYDIGDQILYRPDPCPCGNPHPAFQVNGRSADALKFTDLNGNTVLVPPLLFVTLIDKFHGIELFQVIQSASNAICMRLQFSSSMDENQQQETWVRLHKELQKMFAGRNLECVTIELDDELPRLSTGGKIRMVVPMDSHTAM